MKNEINKIIKGSMLNGAMLNGSMLNGSMLNGADREIVMATDDTPRDDGDREKVIETDKTNVSINKC